MNKKSVYPDNQKWDLLISDEPIFDFINLDTFWQTQIRYHYFGDEFWCWSYYGLNYTQVIVLHLPNIIWALFLYFQGLYKSKFYR